MHIIRVTATFDYKVVSFLIEGTCTVRSLATGKSQSTKSLTSCSSATKNPIIDRFRFIIKVPINLLIRVSKISVILRGVINKWRNASCSMLKKMKTV